MKKNKYVEIFLREAEEHLESLRRGFLSMEKDGATQEAYNGLLRSAHTLKGSANMVELTELAGVAHRMEDLLKELQSGALEFSPDLVDVLLVATDAIEALMAQAHSGGGVRVNVDSVVASLATGRMADPQTETERRAQYSGVERRRSVRASVERLDQLVNRMGEILLSHRAMGEHQLRMAGVLRQFDQLANRLQEAENQVLIKALRSSLAGVVSDFDRDQLQLGYQAEDVYQRAMELRLLPLATITDEFERPLRALARSLDKEILFTVQGQEVELDRSMLDAIKPILLHVLNNAVDHGIEDSETRLKLGKPKAGQVTLKAQYEGSFVQICVRDDGRGLDSEKIRVAAVKRGMLSVEAANAMSHEALLYLVFEPGFTTREFITDVSGRGVGLDVVKANLDQVKGDMTLTSEPGLGTELTLRLPLSTAIFTGLLVASGDGVYIVPQHYVAEILRLSPGDILEEMGSPIIRLHNTSIPLNSLAEILQLEQEAVVSRRLTTLVLRFREQTMALLIDRTIGLQEVVVKELGCQLKSVEFFSGATILNDGTPALILSIADLFAGRQGKSNIGRLRQAHEAAQASASRGRILVVDDSITTRTMEKNILETHHYEVVVAVSGFDALEKLDAGTFDLMVSDVEMPGMTGFELTRKVRQRKDTREMPVIIVSSLASDEHRRQGMDAGAQAYIVKGNFQQGTLLETVETLIS